MGSEDEGRQWSYALRGQRTSSLLDCFCLLALMVDPPTSLWRVEAGVACDECEGACGSRLVAGRGILETGLLKDGMGRLPPREGVFLRVPLLAMTG